MAAVNPETCNWSDVGSNSKVGTISEEETERTKKQEEGEEVCDMLSPGRDLAISLMSSQQLWLPHKQASPNSSIDERRAP